MNFTAVVCDFIKIVHQFLRVPTLFTQREPLERDHVPLELALEAVCSLRTRRTARLGCWPTLYPFATDRYPPGPLGHLSSEPASTRICCPVM